MRNAAFAFLAAILPLLAGCSDLLDSINPPQYHVSVTPIEQDAWNREGRFEVQVAEDVPVHLEATRREDGRTLVMDGQAGLVVEFEDGTWDFHYTVGGHTWGTYSGVRVDTTPPEIRGLQLVGNADASRRYRLGAGAIVTGHAELAVLDLATRTRIATALPVDLNGLADGLHAYLVSARDEAGNHANVTVQVRVGSAVDLPEGQFSFGLVARYTNDVELWDISDLGAYATVEEAKLQVANHYLGSGYGIRPQDPAVQQVVAARVTSDMTTAERAHALLRYMMENLHYDRSRLENDYLLTPSQTLLDTEDKDGRDCADANDADCDGLVMPGSGNGVRGGICRDLAAAYVSLLRAAGVPARLVSGYVAGNVNGFHAWVEFYGGRPASHPGQSAWIPVDVSVVSGVYDEVQVIQAFGIQLPDYLTLRKLPESAEVPGWSTAISLSYRSLRDGPTPEVRSATAVNAVFTSKGVLCFDRATLRRVTADTTDGCGSMTVYVGNFTLTTTRIVDYGVAVDFAPPRTQVTASVSYPFPDPDPSNPEFEFYGGKAFTTDVTTGKATANFEV